MAKLIVCMQRVQLDQWHLDTFVGGVGRLLRATAGIALGAFPLVVALVRQRQCHGLIAHALHPHHAVSVSAIRSGRQGLQVDGIQVALGGLCKPNGIALGGLRRTVGAEYHQHRNQAEQHRSTEASVGRNGRLAAAGLGGLGVQRSGVVTAVAHPQGLLLGDPAEEVPQVRLARTQHVAKAALLCALVAMRAVGCAQRNHVAA
ncbi:hypothetical protein [Xanthomonas oryzae]|uniref:Uncharacterized protein n=1 Tax=Xanthomonas oryzae pv. leersiae TaxID=3112258 RepID=A0AAJ6KLI5_9XANT|nr:hypothetical protein [Xanthomonas oryzae]WIX07307.1 hypothetical protein QN060_04210 [Xanthomonas oryzae pv. oryzae]